MNLLPVIVYHDSVVGLESLKKMQERDWSEVEEIFIYFQKNVQNNISWN